MCILLALSLCTGLFWCPHLQPQTTLQVCCPLVSVATAKLEIGDRKSFQGVLCRFNSFDLGRRYYRQKCINNNKTKQQQNKSFLSPVHKTKHEQQLSGITQDAGPTSAHTKMYDLEADLCCALRSYSPSEDLACGTWMSRNAAAEP